MTYTATELFAFVNRANTPERIAQAWHWCEKHINDEELRENLLEILAIRYNALNE